MISRDNIMGIALLTCNGTDQMILNLFYWNVPDQHQHIWAFLLMRRRSRPPRNSSRKCFSPNSARSAGKSAAIREVKPGRMDGEDHVNPGQFALNRTPRSHRPVRRGASQPVKRRGQTPSQRSHRRLWSSREFAIQKNAMRSNAQRTAGPRSVPDLGFPSRIAAPWYGTAAATTRVRSLILLGAVDVHG
jgi:hypothetical protein